MASTRPAASARYLKLAALILLASLLMPHPGRAGEPSPSTTLTADQKCIAMVTYAEAGGEGELGRRAVIQVIRNRMDDPRFAKSACDVVRAPGEFQPVTMSKRLRDALANPAKADMASALADFGVDRTALDEIARLVALGPNGVASAGPTSPDSTDGALFFVNPHLMDPAKCSWFAKLKRTAAIGGHVFMTSYAPGESSTGPALDCSQVAKDWAAFQKANPIRARGKRHPINPDWLVPIDRSVIAEGGTCSTGTYDPETRTYQKGDC